MKFTLPTNPQQRSWKVCYKGEWTTLRRTIKNENELMAALTKIGHPEEMDIFYLTSCYVIAETFKGKVSKNVITHSDFVLDVDDKDNLERARQNALLCYNMLSINGYEPKYIAFSGSKGYHLVYDWLSLEKIRPNERPEFISRRYRSFLKLHFFRFEDYIDTDVTFDPYRVIRLPGSINQKSGKECKIISLDELKTRLAMPPLKTTRGPTTKTANEEDPRPLDKRGGERTSRVSHPTFISNRVAGTKDRYIPIFKYRLLPSKLLVNLVRRFRLSDLYVFKNEEFYYVLCLKTFQIPRLQKIMRWARAENKGYRARMPFKGLQYMDQIKSPFEIEFVGAGHKKLLEILIKEKSIQKVEGSPHILVSV